jgi:putative endonuclease
LSGPTPERGDDAAGWSLYVVRMRGGELYTGIARDVARRIAEHAAGRGAKCLRGRGPLELAYRVAVGERGLALRLERRLKGLDAGAKRALIASAPDIGSLIEALLPRT